MADPYRDAILSEPLYLRIVEEIPAAPGIPCSTCLSRDNGVAIYVCAFGYPEQEVRTPRCLYHRVKPIPRWVADARTRLAEDPLIGPFLQSVVEEYWQALTGGDLP